MRAVVLGAVRWHSPGVVTSDAPAPASCMESLSGCAQMVAQLSEHLQAIPDEKCHLWVRKLYSLEILPTKSKTTPNIVSPDRARLEARSLRPNDSNASNFDLIHYY